jgi:serine/threonine protein kinase
MKNTKRTTRKTIRINEVVRKKTKTNIKKKKHTHIMFPIFKGASNKIITKKINRKILGYMLTVIHLFPPFTYDYDTRNSNNVIINMTKFPTDLGEYIENNNIYSIDDLNQNLGFDIQNRISNMVDELHRHNILHGDLHERNIVIDPDTKDVKLIDLDDKYCYLITDLNEPDNINKINKFWDTTTIIGKKLNTLDEILVYEKIMWQWCINQDMASLYNNMLEK